MFGKRLKEARKVKSLTLEKLADLYNEEFGSGLNKGTLSKYENDKQEPMISVVDNLSKILNVSVDFLLGKSNTYETSHPDILPLHTKKIRLLGDIACGEPIYANEDFDSYVECGADVKADFCVKAKGNSMINARINDGDIIFVRSQHTQHISNKKAFKQGD